MSANQSKKSKQNKSAVDKVIEKEEVYSEGEFVFRWYHLVSLVVVFALVMTAGTTFFQRYDFSLIGSERQLRIAYGCTEGDAEPNYRYFGVSDGDMFAADWKKVKRVTSLDEAVLELGIINGKPAFKVKENGEWVEERLEFGEEGTYVIDENAECRPGIKIHLSV